MNENNINNNRQRVIKINFAGSGDKFWRKVVRNDEKEIVKYYKSLAKEPESEVEKIIEQAYNPETYSNIMKMREMVKKLEKNKLVPSNQKEFFIMREKDIYVFQDAVTEKYGNRKFAQEGDDSYIYYEKVAPAHKDGKPDVKYTIPGVDGIFSTGATDKWCIYTIKNTVLKMSKIIETKISEWLKTSKVVVWIKGHSRGGVSASLLKEKLKREFGKEIKDKTLEICTTQFDPVPGPKSLSDRPNNLKEAVEVGINPNHYEDMDLDLNELDEMIKSAVIFSLDPKKKMLNETFTMQRVRGAKVVIITPEDHAVGLYETGPDGKKRRYKLNNQIKTYSPGKLWQLDSGIYWAENNDVDEIFELTEIDKKNFREYIKELYSSKVSRYRRDFLINLVYNSEKIKDELATLTQVTRNSNFEYTMKFLTDYFKFDTEFYQALNYIKEYCGPHAAESISEYVKTLKTKNKELEHCKIKKDILDELCEKFG